jgi:hypothetical protein
MTPQEYAKLIYDKHENAIYNHFGNTGNGVEAEILAKQSAIITVNEILTNFVWLYNADYVVQDNKGVEIPISKNEHELKMLGFDMVEYWIQVRSQLSNYKKSNQ